jgi:hypothetical protein
MLKLIIAIAGVVSFWSFATPLFEFPDEQAHIESVEFLGKEGRMPAGEEWDMTAEMKGTQEYLGNFRDEHGRNSYTYHPEYHVEYLNSLTGKYEGEIKSLNTAVNRDTYVWKEAARYPRLYYDYMSIWDNLVHSQDLIFRTYLLRLGNVVLALITALIIYQSGLLIFAKKSHALTLTLLVLLQPMYSFLSAGINSDNLHNLLFAAIIYCGIRIVRDGLSPRLSALTGIVMALDIISKPQGFVAIPIILTAILLHIIQTKKWKLLLGLVGVGIISLIIIALPQNPYSSWISPANVHNASLIEFLRFSLNKLVSQNIVWYWGVFKWLGVVLPPIYWQVANRVVLVAGLGLLVYLWKVYKKRIVIADPYSTFFVLCSIIIYSFAIYYFDWQYTKAVGYSIGVQARYLFPTISAQMALLMIGIISLGWSARIRIWLRRGLVLFIVWMQLGGLWCLLASYYDLSSVQSFIIQVSQYKPDFAKGNWWYLWTLLYLLSLIYLVRASMFKNSRK